MVCVGGVERPNNSGDVSYWIKNNKNALNDKHIRKRAGGASFNGQNYKSR